MSGVVGSKDKKKRRKANVLAAPAPASTSKKNNKKKGLKSNKIDMKEEKCSDLLDDVVRVYLLTRLLTHSLTH